MEINDGIILKVTPCVQVDWRFRLDFLPFAISYAILFSLPFLNKSITLLSLIIIPILLGFQLFIFLISQWSLSLKQYLGYRVVSDVSNATFLFVIAAKNTGKNRVEPLRRRIRPLSSGLKIAGTAFEYHGLYFEFQNILYGYSYKTKLFSRELYPVEGHIEDYLSWQGHESSESITDSIEKWGENIFEIPIPLFLDLYMEHITAPFFVFQVLCLILWSLDDYWYYSAFTLLMLMFFEGMLCRQRQTSLLMLRNMRRPPVPLYAYRSKTWQQVSSEELVPGDVISLVVNSKPTRGRRNHQSPEPPSNDEFVLPCDAIIVRGSCVVNEAMLTGESVPQIKESVATSDSLKSASSESNAASKSKINLNFEGNNDSSWKRHVVMGGTTLLQFDSGPSASQQLSQKVANSTGKGDVLRALENDLMELPPDRGCTAVVVRTGFATVQGGLMRKILFATERVNINNYETSYFIGILVIFALIAAGVVLHFGLQDSNRNKFKLVLHCIMIVTSVVPPELPMELSLAITNSLTSLSRCLVYCTEPFRLPFAGKLDILCFDKTGTLTQDKMYLKGIVPSLHIQDKTIGQIIKFSNDTVATGDGGSASNQKSANNSEGLATDSTMTVDPIAASLAPELIAAAMASCHALVLKTPENVLSYIGDPLEMATFEATNYQFEVAVDPRTSKPHSALLPSLVSRDKSTRITLKHRFPFNSTLKRMSVVAEIQIPLPSSAASFLFTKGAPEVLAGLISNLPPDYKRVYLHHMSKGKRVLALCYKNLSNTASSHTPSQASMSKNHLSTLESRDNLENKLSFLGFLIYDCDMKPDSKSVIRELNESNHKLIMITGDSPYTASDVAARLGMVPKDIPVLILQASSNESLNNLIWRKSTNFEDCGSIDDIIFNETGIETLCRSYSLCITGPSLLHLQAHLRESSLAKITPFISIFARVSPSQKEHIIQLLNESGAYTLMCGDGTNDVGALKAAHVGVSIVNDPNFESRIEGGNKKVKGGGAKDRVARALAELQEQEIDPTIVKLGDASIASPFTSRRTSIDAVMTVLRQGRATLVTTVEVYKILALNCLVSAYMMSALYLQGLKQGDMQMTVNGLISAGLFFFLSQAKPLQRISAKRPSTSVFSSAVISSICGQFIIHFISLVGILRLCSQFANSSENSFMFSTADGKFQPDLINSSIYVLCAMIQVNSFVVNYRGHPFTEGISENQLLWRSIQGIYGAILVVVGGQLEPLNDFLQLTPWPSSQFQIGLVAVLLFNLAAIYAIEKACLHFLE